MEEFLEKLKDDHHAFDKGQLSDHIGNDPFLFFHDWYKQAYDSKQPEANAMVLSTVDAQHKPSSRILYLKELNEDGFIFFTNYHSHKGSDLAQNPNASLLFFWSGLERQIRIEGTIHQTDAAISDEYFASRPRGSQLGAWASQQSQVLESRQVLEERLQALALTYPNEVPRPPHWGGYVLKANRFEFWQGRPSRLHDRLVFELENGDWKLMRLNP